MDLACQAGAMWEEDIWLSVCLAWVCVRMCVCVPVNQLCLQAFHQSEERRHPQPGAVGQKQQKQNQSEATRERERWMQGGRERRNRLSIRRVVQLSTNLNPKWSTNGSPCVDCTTPSHAVVVVVVVVIVGVDWRRSCNLWFAAHGVQMIYWFARLAFPRSYSWQARIASHRLLSFLARHLAWALVASATHNS